jgi:uncharacterized protein (TIGR00304 family)
MRWPPLLSILLFLGGVALIVGGTILHGGQFFLFLIFPGVATESPLALIGFLLIFLSFVAGFLSFSSGPWAETRAPEVHPGPQGRPREGEVQEGHTRKRFGGIVLIGPIPIAFGSDVRITVIMLILAIGLMVVALLAFLLLLR